MDKSVHCDVFVDDMRDNFSLVVVVVCKGNSIWLMKNENYLKKEITKEICKNNKRNEIIKWKEIIRYLNGTLKSDLNVGCIPSDVACWIRETGFEISDGFGADERLRKLCWTDCGGAGGKKPCDGFNGVMWGGSLGGNGWCGAVAAAFASAEIGVGREKVPVDVEFLFE